MPSSPPGPLSPESTTKPANSVKVAEPSDTTNAMSIVGMVIGAIFLFLWHFGAASLSYAKYGSIGWAILDFFFATIYYPYYALFLNTPTPVMQTMMGGRRRKWF